MSNSTNTSPPGSGRSASRALTPSLTTHGRSFSQGAATVQQTNLTSDGDDRSISSQRARKRDKLMNFFRSAKSEGKATQGSLKTKIHGTPSAATEARDVGCAGSSSKVASAKTTTDSTTDLTGACSNIFPSNVIRPSCGTDLPKPYGRIDTTPQLVLCSSLLNSVMSKQGESSLEKDPDQPKDASSSSSSSQNVPTNYAHRNWVEHISEDPVEQYHIRWLQSRMVEEFAKDAVKGSTAITEVVLLGPVLDGEQYRSLLSCFINKFDHSVLLDVDLLHGLVQLVQCASKGYLFEDDLVKIMSIIRKHLQDTHQQSSDHPYHLTLALSRILDVMAQHEVKDVNRVEQHEPLAEVLRSLQGSTDPFLMYQASYAFQALQCIPDDETALQAVMRRSGVVAEGLVNISGVVHLDLGGFLDGLGQIQKTIVDTIGITRTAYEGARSLIESGQDVLAAIKEGARSGSKRAWYPAIIGANAMVREGRLADFKVVVLEAACRKRHEFQWGICQLLGEIALDPLWESTTRQQAVDLLVELYSNDPSWGQDASVKSWMLTILHLVSDRTDLKLKVQGLGKADEAMFDKPYLLLSRFAPPQVWPLLCQVQKITYVERDLNRLRNERLQEYSQNVYIPPLAKASLQASDKDAQPLMSKIEQFLESDQQVFLVLGDSGAGKSTFNKHLEYKLWNEYKQEGRVPLFVNLPAIDRPDQDLIAKQLSIHNFSDQQIQELKQHRQIILRSIPNMMELVRNPFLLSLSLRALPRVVGDAVDLANIKVTRLTLYDSFINQWLEISKLRLENINFSEETKSALQELLEGGLTMSAIAFSKDLAAAIFREQDGNPVVQYRPIIDKKTWKVEFFGLESHITLLRESSPLSRAGTQHRFFHRSLLEYFYSRHVYEPSEQNTESEVSWSIADHPLSLRNLVKEPSIVQFLAEQVQRDSAFKHGLRQIIDLSKSDAHASQAAANAITILVRAGVLFNGEDLRGIRVPGADMSGGQFDSAQLQGADLRNTNLRSIWLRQADLSKAQMAGVQFGESPFLNGKASVNSCAYSPDGELFATGLSNGTINLYKTATWKKTHTLNGHTREVLSVVFSPNSQQIASGSEDSTVRLWDAQTGAPGAILNGHTGEVWSVVFSPNGQQISSGSWDRTVRLWDAQTGAPTAILKGHTDHVWSVVFSPSGQQIASGSSDSTVRLWDTQTSAPGAILKGHRRTVRSVVFSLNGQQIASGSSDSTVRLWDAQTGTPGVILNGHTADVMSVAFSPNGQQIASGSEDRTVRLWDAQTGAPGAILNGHTNLVWSVVFSPNGQQIASGSRDRMVRLWDARTGAPGALLNGHTDYIRSVVFSPNGQQIASGSSDRTVRLWDAQTGAPGAILKGHRRTVRSVVFSPNGHTGYVLSVVFSPNGQQVASGSEDRTVRLWDIDSGHSLTIIKGFHGAVNAVAWHACLDGSYLATGCRDKSVRLWEVIGACHVVHLLWSSQHEQLIVSKAIISTAQDLSRLHEKLLKQRGAVNQPISLKEP